MLGFWEEVGQLALVELCLSDHTALEKVLSGAIEGSVEEGEESKSILAEDLLVEIGDLTRDIHALEDGFGGGHIELLLIIVKIVSCLCERGECAARGRLCRSICLQYVRREGLDSTAAVGIISGRVEHGNVEVFGRVWKQPKSSVSSGGGEASSGYPRACECGETPESFELCPSSLAALSRTNLRRSSNMTPILIQLMLLLSSEQIDFVVRSVSIIFISNLHVLSVHAHTRR